MPSLPTTSPTISALPTWVILMASATPTPVTFDAQKAVSFVDSGSPTTAQQSPSSASATVPLAQSSSTTPGAPGSSMSSVQSTASSGFSPSSTSPLPAPTAISGAQHGAFPTAAIIGIAVGSVLLLSLALLLCRYCRRIQRRSPIAAGSLQHLHASDSPREEHDTSITPSGPEAQGTIRPYSVFRCDFPATVGHRHGKVPPPVDFEPVSESSPNVSTDTAGRLREQIAAQEARIRELESQTQMTLNLPALRDDGASGVSISSTGRQPPMYSEGGRGPII